MSNRRVWPIIRGDSGQSLHQNTWVVFVSEITLRDVRYKAMDLLARREHSVGELRRKLKQRDYEPALIEATLEGLLADTLLNDAQFAKSYVRMRARRGYGPVRIRKELMEREVEGGIVEEPLSAFTEQWWGLAATVRHKRFGHAAPDDFQQRAKQARFLQYRGFDHEHIMCALDDTGME